MRRCGARVRPPPPTRRDHRTDRSMKRTNSARQPLSELLREKNHVLRGVSGLEFYEAFLQLCDRLPEKENGFGRCVYNTADLSLVLSRSICPESALKELEQWKKLLPLAPTLTRKNAIKRLIAIGDSGWLQRCSYKRGALLLCEADAEQLCFIRKTGYRETPARWSLPVALGPQREPVPSAP